MSKFIIGVCCGIVIVAGFIHIVYLKKNKETLPDES